MEQSRTTGLDQPVTVDLTGRGASPTHLRLADAPQHGSVALGPDGTAVYTPDTGFSGEDSFTYTFTGGSGVAISGVVHVRVGDAVRLPRTGADTARDIAAGLGLLLVGFLLLAVGRRRTDDDEPETA
jgi:LPXTG-motif cell wall-anchored protein